MNSLDFLAPTPGYDEYYESRLSKGWISISALNTFVRCPRKFFYSFGCDLGPAGGEHLALKFGEAIHASVGIMLGEMSKYPPHQITDHANEVFTKAFDRFMLVWGDRDRENDEKRNSVNARWILLNFQSRHLPGFGLYEILTPPPSPIAPEDNVSDYEVRFAVDIGLPVPLVGRIDGIARHRDTGKLLGLEFKTCSQMTDLLFNGFRLNPQILGYALALRTIGKSLEQYYDLGQLDEFYADFIHVPKPLKTKATTYDGQLLPISITDHHLQDFLQWAQYNGARMLEMEQKKSFPKHFSGCHPYPMFGSLGYPCEFMTLCSGPDWTVFKDLYSKMNYNPYKLAPVQTEANGPVELTINGTKVGQ
jgi:hypothetical protein